MQITKPTDFISSYLVHRLHPGLTVEQIEAALPGIEDEGPSGDNKAQHRWDFLADGKECSIWDMQGLRWSAYGPKTVFEALGLTVIGGVNDAEKAIALSKEVQ